LTKDLYYYKDGTVSDELDDNKILHREDGPACIEDGFAEAWFFDGVRHREQGPAVIYADGKVEWWVRGVKVPPKS